MPWLRPIVGVSLCSIGAALQHREQRVEIGDQDVRRPAQLHGEAGVEHVRAGHALVQEARLGPDMLGDTGQEGDDVVLRLGLDRVDPVDVERRAFLRVPHRLAPPPSGRRRARPSRRAHAPRSRTRSGSGFRAPRWRPSRGASSGGSCSCSWRGGVYDEPGDSRDGKASQTMVLGNEENHMSVDVQPKQGERFQWLNAK